MFDLTEKQMIEAKRLYDLYIPQLKDDLKKRFEEATKHDCNTMVTPEGIYGLLITMMGMGKLCGLIQKFYEVAVTTALDVEAEEDEMFMTHVHEALDFGELKEGAPFVFGRTHHHPETYKGNLKEKEEENK